MRPTKFRGKRVDNNEWVYGLPIQYFDKFYIMHLVDFNEDRVYGYAPNTELYSRQVDPNSIGQSTGLTDKNGKEIYKGDIVVFVDDKYDTTEKPEAAEILFNESGVTFRFSEQERVGSYLVDQPKLFFYTQVGSDFECEIIGNIYENRELLKSKREHPDCDVNDIGENDDK